MTPCDRQSESRPDISGRLSFYASWPQKRRMASRTKEAVPAPPARSMFLENSWLFTPGGPAPPFGAWGRDGGPLPGGSPTAAASPRSSPGGWPTSAKLATRRPPQRRSTPGRCSRSHPQRVRGQHHVLRRHGAVLRGEEKAPGPKQGDDRGRAVKGVGEAGVVGNAGLLFGDIPPARSCPLQGPGSPRPTGLLFHSPQIQLPVLADHESQGAAARRPRWAKKSWGGPRLGGRICARTPSSTCRVSNRRMAHFQDRFHHVPQRRSTSFRCSRGSPPGVNRQIMPLPPLRSPGRRPAAHDRNILMTSL